MSQSVTVGCSTGRVEAQWSRDKCEQGVKTHATMCHAVCMVQQSCYHTHMLSVVPQNTHHLVYMLPQAKYNPSLQLRLDKQACKERLSGGVK